MQWLMQLFLLHQKKLKKIILIPNSMNLIDEELKNKLHSNYTIKEMVGGGSAWKLYVWNYVIWW